MKTMETIMLTSDPAVESSDLLACPFCGQVPKMHEQYLFRLMANSFQVQCGCGCYSPRYKTLAEAARWWNTRQDNDQTQPRGGKP